MNNFKSTSRRNPCPLCQDIKGKCRTLPDNPDLILCAGFPDGTSGLAGWRFLKPANNPFWGLHAVDQKLDHEEKRRRREEWERQKQIRQQQREQQLQQVLSPERRDKAIRLLHKNYYLRTSDRQHLLERGLTDAQIEAGLFFSLDSLNDLPPGVPFNFPGVGKDGKLRTQGKAIAIPAFDTQGRAIGGQYRLTNVTEGGRYCWLSCEQSSAHLSNGELPLTYCQPNQLQQPIPALAEGFLKPQLAAAKLGQIVIGAAGGYFTLAPQQLRQYLTTANLTANSQDSLPSEVIIYPDAGDVANPNVMKRWQSHIELFTQWGIKTWFGWWGQLTKDHDDIDELTNLSLIKLISWEEFSQIAQSSQPLPVESNENEQKRPKNTERLWRNWRNFKQFTPNFTINQPYFDYPTPQPGTILAIKSPLGTGKTEWLGRVVEQLGGEWLGLGHRNTLLIQSSKRWGFTHLQSEEEIIKHAIRQYPELFVRITSCLDSIIYFSPEDFENRWIVLDETESIIRHLFEAKTAISRYRDRAQALFKEALRRARGVICLDGLLTDQTIAYLSQLAPDKQVVKVENTYKASNHKITLYRSFEGETERKRDRSALIKAMFISAQQEPIAIFSDSQIELEALDKLFTEAGKNTFRLDSTTSLEESAAFLSQPSQFIVNRKVEVLLISPSAESGLDISLRGYFKTAFYLFFGVILTNSQTQMLFRLRDPNCERHIFCVEKAASGDNSSRSLLPERVMRSLQEYAIDSVMTSLDAETDVEVFKEKALQLIANCFDNENFRQNSKLIALSNYERANLRKCLIESLELSGHAVKIKDTLKFDISELTEAKNAVKQQKAEDIFNAQEVPIEQVNKINPSKADWQTHCQVIKSRLLDRLPGIAQEPVFSPQFIKDCLFSNRNYLLAIELYYLLKNPDKARKKTLINLFKMVEHFESDAQLPDLTRYRDPHLQVKALLELGIAQFLAPDAEWSDSSPEVIELCRKAKSAKYARWLGTHPGQSPPVRFVNRLLGMLGVEITSTQVREGEQRNRVYRVSSTPETSEQGQAVLRAIERKINGFLSQNLPLNFGESKAAETLVQQDSNPVTDSPDNLYINTAASVTEFEQQCLMEEFQDEIVTELEKCPDLESLEGLRQLFPVSALKRAAKRLSTAAETRIREWVIQLNQLSASG